MKKKTAIKQHEHLDLFYLILKAIAKLLQYCWRVCEGIQTKEVSQQEQMNIYHMCVVHSKFKRGKINEYIFNLNISQIYKDVKIYITQ